MFRRRAGALEVLLAHPGGPFFARKDAGAWTVPKGLVDDGEDLLVAARREFTEETALCTPPAGYVALGEARLPSGKRVHAFAFEGDCEPSTIRSNTFELEWPPRSGRKQAFPEVDRAAWYGVDAARAALAAAQRVFLDRLVAALETR